MPPQLYGRAHSVANRLTDIANDMTHTLKMEELGKPAAEDGWLKAYHAVEEEVDPLFKEIVQEVQKRLGIEDTDDKCVLGQKGSVTDIPPGK